MICALKDNTNGYVFVHSKVKECQVDVYCIGWRKKLKAHLGDMMKMAAGNNIS
jgi:hypothetical protein